MENYIRLCIVRFWIVFTFCSVIDVRSCPEFCFRPITYHYDVENVHLGLFFRPWLSTKQTKNIRAKYRIIQRFFNINLPSPSVDPQELVEEETEKDDAAEKANSMPSVSELYSLLRDAHERNNTEFVHYTQMPKYFVPELRSYQSKALQWMLNSEKSTRYSHPEFVPITCPAVPNETFYFNHRTVELMDYDPGGLKMPTGGILADEMGLGKTVEMLALILSNPNLKRKRMDTEKRPAGESQDRKEMDKISKLSFFLVLSKKLQKKEVLRCVCSLTQTGNKIQCSRCLYFQHEKCVTKYSLRPIVNYICPECWKSEAPIQSSTTFIVSPPSIKMQWNEEIQKHIANSSFRVSQRNDNQMARVHTPYLLEWVCVVIVNWN